MRKETRLEQRQRIEREREPLSLRNAFKAGPISLLKALSIIDRELAAIDPEYEGGEFRITQEAQEALLDDIAHKHLKVFLVDRSGRRSEYFTPEWARTEQARLWACLSWKHPDGEILIIGTHPGGRPRRGRPPKEDSGV